MKIFIECKSPLMQKSMEMFLKDYLSASRQCDIILRDEKCLNDERCFYVSTKGDADLVKPFTKAQLVFALEKKYKMLQQALSVEDNSGLSFEVLEKRIAYLTQEYQENILKAVKAFYEK